MCVCGWIGRVVGEEEDEDDIDRGSGGGKAENFVIVTGLWLQGQVVLGVAARALSSGMCLGEERRGRVVWWLL